MRAAALNCTVYIKEEERVGEERGVESGGGSLPHGLFNKNLFHILYIYALKPEKK